MSAYFLVAAASILQDRCTLEPQVGECYNYAPRWFFNVAEHRCSQFYWGGCGGNENNFATEQECNMRCVEQPATTAAPRPTVAEPFRDEFCFLEPDAGPCDRMERRFHYEQGSGVCREFAYGGCGGNRNNFLDLETCRSYCSNVQDVCQLRMFVGSCNDSIMQWYYEARSDSCSQFTYSGCGGNDNRFNSLEECEYQCRTTQPAVATTTTTTTTAMTPSIDARLGEECRMPESLSVCGEERVAWYYDEQSGRCSQTTAGACDYSGLYQSEEACERQCGIFRLINVCDYPLDRGNCRAEIPKIYYDQESGHCLDYMYGGCAGSPNRFSTVEECESVCASAKRHRPETSDDNMIADTCDEYVADCARINCDYGVERRKTDAGCQECVCRHPCSSLQCGEGERCALQPVYTAAGDRKFTPICRLSSKPGVCQNLTSSADTQCDRYCNDDADCAGDDKCCARGCSFECQSPESERPTTPLRPRVPYTPSYPEVPAAPQVNEDETPPETAMEEGGLATLRCVFNGYPAPTITWQRGALTIDGTTGRYRISTDGSLQIVSVYRNDSGVYVCIGNNPLGEVRKEVTLTVRDPVETPALILGEGNASVIGLLHHPLLLRCFAYGYPAPEVYWFKGDKMLPFESQYYEINRDGLTLRSLEVEILGEYTCQAFNGIGNAASWSIAVKAYRIPEEVAYSPWLIGGEAEETPKASTRATTTEYIDPNIIPEYRPPSYNVPVRTSIDTERTTFAVGSDLTLPCYVEGLPQPRVVWTKDNVPLESSERVHISDVNRLTIFRVGESDAGTYTCHADNGLSSHFSYVQIAVEGVSVHPNCTDNQLFANCHLIVKGKYCRHQYYASFCCRSCTLAGQLTLQDMVSDQPRFKAWKKK